MLIRGSWYVKAVKAVKVVVKLLHTVGRSWVWGLAVEVSGDEWYDVSSGGVVFFSRHEL
jgi:hypothetical protein